MKTPGGIRWAAGAAGALLVAGILFTLVLNHGTRQQNPTRAREYTSHQACLLTDSHGITTPQTATVWAGMEDASLATHTKVMYLQTSGPATTGNAIPYANTLIQRHCDMILAVGAPQTTALTQIAHTSPTTHFLLIQPGSNSTHKNLTTLNTSSGMRNQVAHTIEAATSS